MINQQFSCPICNSPSNIQIMDNRPDYEFGLPYKVNYHLCLNKSCELVFVSPIPSASEISKFYQTYSTHNSNIKIDKLQLIAKVNQNLYLKRIAGLFNNDRLDNVNVLDFGCGNGNLMKHLLSIGVTNVIGYDMDPNACSCAIAEGLNAYSDLEKIEANGLYNYIFLNHVIEHLSDPADTIRFLSTHLKPGGKIIIRTPNSKSFLAGFFGEMWRGWETPRHLHVFNVKSIRKLIEGISGVTITKLETSNYMFSGIFNESFHSVFFRQTILGKVLRKLIFVLLLPISLVFNLVYAIKGEEISMIASKNNS